VCVYIYTLIYVCIYTYIYGRLLKILDHNTIYIVYFIVNNLIPFTSSMWLNSTQKLGRTALDWYKCDYCWITWLT